MSSLFRGQCKYLWAIGIVAVLALLFLCSCSPQRRLGRLATAHPDATATICARMYPVRESSNVRIETRTDTQRVPGPVVYVDCDSARVYQLPGDTSRLLLRVPCPPTQLIRTLVTKDSVVRVENTAALAEARNQAKAAELRGATLAKSRQIWRIAALVMAALFIIIVALKWLRKLI